MREKDQLQIFLAHASEDKQQVRQLYQQLKQAGYKPWLDEEDLIAGLNWRQEIPKAIKNSDIFLACFSHKSVTKDGYIQRELRYALSEYTEKPPGSIFLIPVRLEDCSLPDLEISALEIKLSDLHWVDYWGQNGFEKILRSIEYQRSQLEPKHQPTQAKQERIEKRSQLEPKLQPVQEINHPIQSAQIGRVSKTAIQFNIQRLREQLAGLYDALVIAAPEDRVRLKQLIDAKKAEIRDFENFCD